MSVPTIAPYFPFRRIKIIKQSVMPEAGSSAYPAATQQTLCSDLPTVRPTEPPVFTAGLYARYEI